MKSIPYLTRAGAVLFACAFAALLAACGQKGPLYFPKPAPIATPATKPVPAPVEESALPNLTDPVSTDDQNPVSK
ncbi:LPS translocon maturation chaperone LptM [Noviherbaspirillum cavernae]|uniref:LPS translocon maturation chaperone LptM n=1 Tax=Noviherbaspirillum cavernae TaxID=2320862 RepID=UPI0018F48165|nr:lipoprotein [Noviherbaspirillum cavernae]